MTAEKPSTGRVPLWDPDGDDDIDFTLYEPHYAPLFRAMRREGWAPGRTQKPPREALRRSSRLTVSCDWGDAFLWSFWGISLRGSRPTSDGSPGERAVTLRAGAVFDQLMQDRISMQLLLRYAFGTDRALAVAEADGRALLVNGRGQAAFVESNYASYVYGDNPFSVLSWYLYDEPHPDVRLCSVPVEALYDYDKLKEPAP